MWPATRCCGSWRVSGPTGRSTWPRARARPRSSASSTARRAAQGPRPLCSHTASAARRRWPCYTQCILPYWHDVCTPLIRRRSHVAPAEPGPPAGICGRGGPLLRGQRAQRGHRVVDHARPAHVRACLPGARAPPGLGRMRRATACGMCAALLAAPRCGLQASTSSLQSTLGHNHLPC